MTIIAYGRGTKGQTISGIWGVLNDGREVLLSWDSSEYHYEENDCEEFKATLKGISYGFGQNGETEEYANGQEDLLDGFIITNVVWDELDEETQIKYLFKDITPLLEYVCLQNETDFTEKDIWEIRDGVLIHC